VKISAIISTAMILICLSIGISAESQANPADDLNRQMFMENLSLSPLFFTENQGQWDERVLFRADAGGWKMWFTAEGVYYHFVRTVSRSESDEDDLLDPLDVKFNHEPDSIEQLVLNASFVGANLKPDVWGDELMEYKCNYFIGNNPDEWHTDVPNYQSIYFEDIYPGIDLKYYGNRKQMEYDFIISPGADYSRIQIQYEGAKTLSINSAGELIIETEWGNIIERKPIVYQLSEGKRIEIEGAYELTAGTKFSFRLDDDYNPDLPLVIDPVLVYSTYLGGGAEDYGGDDIAVDDSGNAYVVGVTFSSDFPTFDPYQEYQAAPDAFVTKLSITGESLIYSTYLGGSGGDDADAIALDGSGGAYVVGYTNSTDFPIKNQYQTHQGGADIFVTKLSSSGDSLVYSTYLGGSLMDLPSGLALDDSGCTYITGRTYSADFPTLNPYQTDQEGSDAFITKLANSGDNLVYSTYLGGSSFDVPYGIYVDMSGYAYVTGYTNSSDFPTLNPYQTDQGGNDAFVTKFSSMGSSLIYSTYLGGSGSEIAYSIAVDSSGIAYITGSTMSTDFPILNPYQSDQDTTDVFVTMLSSTGSELLYGTYLGGDNLDYSSEILLDSSGSIYIAGYTHSTNFPTFNPYQTDRDTTDIFVIKLSSSGDGLLYGTYLGGNGSDVCRAFDLDDMGCVYLTGRTESQDFPTLNAFQTYQGGSDVFVTKLCESWQPACGDANGDGEIGIGDAVYEINYVFLGGDSPNPPECGDANCDEAIGLIDIVYIVNYIFRGGNPPCDLNGDDIPDC
jgi:hypothetical protein